MTEFVKLSINKLISFERMRLLFAPLLICLFLISCRPETYTPKPRAYFHVDFPERKYQVFDDPRFPYRFEYPVYARIIKDTTFWGKKPENPYWINLDFPTLGGRVYISYKDIKPGENLQKVMEDAYEMTMYHTKRADFINDFEINNDSVNVHGIFSDVGGNAASAYQFYATDSTKHFLRGALYFDVTPNIDSLKPINEFIRTDLEHMLWTLRWK